MTQRLELGQVVVTRGINEDMKDDIIFRVAVNKALSQYIACDWGETSEEDKPLNDWAVDNGERILAAYETHRGRIWIITEYDRSVTTVLYPGEY